MKLLLDSSVLLWAIYEPEKLSITAFNSITDAENTRYLSDASLWELGLKIAKGKLGYESSQTSFRDRIRAIDARSLAISQLHIQTAITLPPHHADPFDRMLIAQAQLENMALVTSDRNIGRYEAKIVW